MMAPTHIAAGVVCALSVGLYYHAPLEAQILLLFGSMIGSLLPDIDHPRSWLGSRLPFISLPISKFFGHRGITHSLIALVAIFYAAFQCMNEWGSTHKDWMPLVFGVCVGYASHLLADCFTPAGIPLLWPMKAKFRSPLTCPTGERGERIILTGLWFGAGFLLAKMI